MSNRRFLKLAIALSTWFLTICLLGIWWGRLALTQARRIAELETSLGLASSTAESHWHRTQRMLYWESGTFLVLLLASTLGLLWLYWRDARRSKGLQAFFASVTHELRTPLSSIRLQAESIADSLGNSEKLRAENSPHPLHLQNSTVDSRQNLIRRLLEDTIRLEAQVERTLELARVEGGGPVYTQPLLIKPWLDRFLASWTADYHSRVELKSDIEDVLIQADPTAMQIIFKNLLENSVKHSKKDQVKIDISVNHRPDGGVLVSLRDDGQGYLGDARALGKIFQKGAYSPGTGVGLYLVQVLMKRMGGWIHFSPGANRADTDVRNWPGFAVSLWLPDGRSNHG